ncbi:hypothetical protein [Streptomyces sp. NPDC048445]|uniref:hypothetical protein n=1 Tax=Streptomyces sp. NPDC048445 TaxID=3365553 RepID=UPI003711AEF7
MADLFTSAPVREPLTPTALRQRIHEQHCTRCRALTVEADACAAANASSMRRRDRIQLGLHLTTDPDMDEALRRVREGQRPAVIR